MIPQMRWMKFRDPNVLGHCMAYGVRQLGIYSNNLDEQYYCIRTLFALARLYVVSNVLCAMNSGTFGAHNMSAAESNL